MSAARWWAEMFLYPGDEDPLAMAEAAGGIVHEGWSVDTALESMAANRGRDLDRLSRRSEIEEIGMETRRVTMAQALLSFLKNQYVERDGQQHKFFAGCWEFSATET